jgi:hypothetical protein
MAKKKKSNIRVKSVEVSSASFWGKSELDKALEKYQNEGWTLVNQQHIKGKRYLLTFEYEPDAKEVAEEKKKESKRGMGCLVLLFLCAVIYFLPNSNRDRPNSNNRRSEPTRVIQATSVPERTSVSARATAAPQDTVSPDEPTEQENVVSLESASLSIAEIQQTAMAVTDTPEATNNPRIVTNTPIAEAQVAEPSDTDRPTRAPQPTDTERPSRTPQPTDTERPSRTPQPTEVDTDTHYVTGSTANVRECANRDCETLTALSYGEDIEVIESVEGENVSGTTRWYRVLLNDGRDGFIYSTLVSTTRPVAGSSSGNGSGSASSSSNNSGSSGSGSSNNVQPTEVPQQQAQPTQPPPPPQTTWNCSGDIYNCGDFSTCSDMYSYWNACPGDPSGLDGNDNDGRPCESRCG